MDTSLKIAIIGAGASGCFCAVNLKRLMPDCEVDIFESQSQAMTKLALTGGGRCNITNTFEGVEKLHQVYPRGDKLLNRVFSRFDSNDLIQWFEQAGLELYSQPDGRVFPASNNAMDVVDTLLHKMEVLGIRLHLKHKVKYIDFKEGKFQLTFLFEDKKPLFFDKVVVCTGGFIINQAGQMLKSFDLKLVPPVGSLFGFNIQGDLCPQLMGTSVERVSLRLAATRFKASGSILFTHWGFSGPAVLKLSSLASRYLFEKNYQATLLVNWFDSQQDEDVRELLQTYIEDHAQRLVSNCYPNIFSQKHWLYFLTKAKVPHTQRWASLTKTHINRLVSLLTNDSYTINGKAHYKKEFVTSGGIALSNINFDTMEANTQKGLFFAGEVLDVDAFTGGFNLQAAWSTAFQVAHAIASNF